MTTRTTYQEQATKREADIMLSELEHAVAVRLSKAVRAPIDDPWQRGEFLAAMSGGTVSTFPRWFQELGRNKKDVAKALEQIRSGKEPKTALGLRILDIIEDHLTNGQDTPMGFIPADLDYKNVA